MGNEKKKLRFGGKKRIAIKRDSMKEKKQPFKRDSLVNNFPK